MEKKSNVFFKNPKGYDEKGWEQQKSIQKVVVEWEMLGKSKINQKSIKVKKRFGLFNQSIWH